MLCASIWRKRHLHKCRKQSQAIRKYVLSAIGIDVVSGQKRSKEVVSAVHIDAVSGHVKYCRTAYGIDGSIMHCKVQMNDL